MASCDVCTPMSTCWRAQWRDSSLICWQFIVLRIPTRVFGHQNCMVALLRCRSSNQKALLVLLVTAVLTRLMAEWMPWSVWSVNRASMCWDEVVLNSFTSRDWFENFRVSLETFLYLCDQLNTTICRQTQDWERLRLFIRGLPLPCGFCQLHVWVSYSCSLGWNSQKYSLFHCERYLQSDCYKCYWQSILAFSLAVNWLRWWRVSKQDGAFPNVLVPSLVRTFLFDHQQWIIPIIIIEKVSTRC